MTSKKKKKKISTAIRIMGREQNNKTERGEKRLNKWQETKGEKGKEAKSEEKILLRKCVHEKCVHII